MFITQVDQKLKHLSGSKTKNSRTEPCESIERKVRHSISEIKQFENHPDLKSDINTDDIVADKFLASKQSFATISVIEQLNENIS